MKKLNQTGYVICQGLHQGLWQKLLSEPGLHEPKAHFFSSKSGLCIISHPLGKLCFRFIYYFSALCHQPEKAYVSQRTGAFTHTLFIFAEMILLLVGEEVSFDWWAFLQALGSNGTPIGNQGSVLTLLRSPNKPSVNKWMDGVPTGV